MSAPIMLCCMDSQQYKKTRRALTANLLHLMEKYGDTQASLAKRAGVTQSNVSYILSTERNVRLDTVEAVAAAYGLNGWHLLNPDLPADLVDSPSLAKLVSSYIKTSSEGRALIDAVADREAAYAANKPA